MLEYIPLTHQCPLCESSSIESHFSIAYKGLPFKTSRCTGCGFIFMNPRFTDETLASFYGKEYYAGGAEFSYLDERTTEKHAAYVWNARLKKINSYAPQGRFLDIGASFGGFMRAAKSKYESFGIELSPYSGSIAQKEFGAHLHIGTLDDHPFPKDFFSAITIIEVIEHLADPLHALHQCFELLSPGGVLIVQTADLDSWQALDAGAAYHYYLPGHCSYFTENSLTKALIAAGFSYIDIYRPVDFGLLPKLLKSRGSFKKFSDYRRWISIIHYHIKGYFRYKGKPLTASMVIYAVK